jgi:hypothetical protein
MFQCFKIPVALAVTDSIPPSVWKCYRSVIIYIHPKINKTRMIQDNPHLLI